MRVINYMIVCMIHNVINRYRQYILTYIFTMVLYQCVYIGSIISNINVYDYIKLFMLLSFLRNQARR